MQPMLCKQGQADERFDADVWATEAKFDGWRLLSHRNGDHVRVVAGRNGSDYSGQLPRIERALELVLPPNTTVDGEIVAANGWGGVQHAMTTGHAHEDDDLVLVIFDVIRLDGHDLTAMPWSDRRRLVEQIDVSGPQLAISPLFPTAPSTLENVLANGFEGVVLKRKSSRYVYGRSPYWVKVKPQQTAEAVVTGFKPGNGSFAGLIGAIEFQMIDTGAQSRCSGFDMNLRREITANPTDWIGQVIEIKHHGIGREGKPRHPQFLRRRKDRDTGTASRPLGSVTTQQSEISPPRKLPTRRSSVSAPRMRNYAAMGDAKLLRCIDELEAREGDAYERCVSKGGDPAADFAAAQDAAQGRGLR